MLDDLAKVTPDELAGGDLLEPCEKSERSVAMVDVLGRISPGERDQNGDEG